MKPDEFLDEAVDYLNENLSPDRRTAFERTLQTNGSPRQQMQNLEDVRAMLTQQVTQETEAAWTLMRARLQSEKPAANGMKLWWRHWRMRLSLLAAVSVALLEGALLVNAPSYRALPENDTMRQIQVVFAPDAQQRQVRAVLDQVHAQINAGPGPGGEYTLSVPEADVPGAVNTLRAAPGVQDAYPINTRP
ncbi:MAG: anti-sigma factor [Thiobacillus sp.]